MQTVYVLVIEHRHGTDINVRATWESAHRCLDAYCREWWAGEARGRSGRMSVSPPDDATACIQEYFEAVDDEFYSIQQCIVAP